MAVSLTKSTGWSDSRSWQGKDLWQEVYQKQKKGAWAREGTALKARDSRR